MTSFSWLHLTDFHQGMRGHNLFSPQVKQIFFEDLNNFCDRWGKLDLVLFTGDLTFQGSSDEFQEVNDFLTELENKLGYLPTLLAVPGNHDLVRPSNLNDVPLFKLLKSQPDNQEIEEQLKVDLRKGESVHSQKISNAFAHYVNWLRSSKHQLTNLNNGMLPGDFSHTFEKDGCKLGILGLNTSFVQLTGGDYEGKLILDVEQFHNACRSHGYNDGPTWANDHHACVLLTHHPSTWLTKNSQEKFQQEIVPYFDVHLCGHLHEAASQNVSQNWAKSQLTWQGRSFFGLEYCDKPKQLKRLHGYTVGRIELNGKRGEFKFWPREARLQGDQRKIVPDYSFNLHDNIPHTKSNNSTKFELNLTAPENENTITFSNLVDSILNKNKQIKDWKQLHQDLQTICLELVFMRKPLIELTEEESHINLIARNIKIDWSTFSKKLKTIVLFQELCEKVVKEIEDKTLKSQWLNKIEDKINNVDKIVIDLDNIENIDDIESKKTYERKYKISSYSLELHNLDQTLNEFLNFIDKKLKDNLKEFKKSLEKLQLFTPYFK